MMHTCFNIMFVDKMEPDRVVCGNSRKYYRIIRKTWHSSFDNAGDRQAQTSRYTSKP